MNAPVTSDYYTPAAYRNSAIPAQPAHKWPQDANRSGPTRTLLRWGSYANLEPWQDIDAQLQPAMRAFIDRKDENDLYINHKNWKFENSSKWMMLIPFLKWWSIVFAPWFFWGFAITGALSNFSDWIIDQYGLGYAATFGTILALFSVLLMALNTWYMWADEPKTKNYLIANGSGLIIALASSLLTFQTSPYGTDLLLMCSAMALSIFMGLIGWDYLLDLYLRVFAHDGSGFNRQTGMLTIGRRFRKPFSAPFYEFDATLEFRPGPHGNSGFAIWLHHRYADVEVFLGGKLQSLGMNLEEALAFWDSLQRYMDVTQPLPDLPLLEQFRHLDPVTAAHDQQHSRQPRRWRDMPYSIWERRGRSETMKRNREHKWQQQPCILQAKIDPSLTIEAYYRSQEARGIASTPKADDFDNVHRG